MPLHVHPTPNEVPMIHPHSYITHQVWVCLSFPQSLNQYPIFRPMENLIHRHGIPYNIAPDRADYCTTKGLAHGSRSTTMVSTGCIVYCTIQKQPVPKKLHMNHQLRCNIPSGHDAIFRIYCLNQRPLYGAEFPEIKKDLKSRMLGNRSGPIYHHS